MTGQDFNVTSAECKEMREELLWFEFLLTRAFSVAQDGGRVLLTVFERG